MTEHQTKTPDLDTCPVPDLMAWCAPRAEWAREPCPCLGAYGRDACIECLRTHAKRLREAQPFENVQYHSNDCVNCGGVRWRPRRDTAAAAWDAVVDVQEQGYEVSFGRHDGTSVVWVEIPEQFINHCGADTKPDAAVLRACAKAQAAQEG